MSAENPPTVSTFDLPPVSFHDFYDPLSRDDRHELLDKLIRHRANPILVAGIGRISGIETLSAEATEAQLVAPYITDESVAERTLHRSHVTSLAVTDVMSMWRAEKPRNPTTHPDVPTQYYPLVDAGVVMAAGAYQGQTRRSGQDYFEHPADVASIIERAWMKFNPRDESLLPVLLFLAYVHDGFENAFDVQGSSFLRTKKILASPLVVERVLKDLSYEDHAAEVADALMLLSKPVGIGYKADYVKYVARGAHNKYFVLTKLADIQHNLSIDPKIVFETMTEDSTRIHKKRDQYATARNYLLKAGEKIFNFEEMSLMHAIANLKGRELFDLPRSKNDRHIWLAEKLSGRLATLYELAA